MKLYNDIKDTDATVKAMKEVMQDDGEEETDLPHKKVARLDESANPNASLHGGNRGALCYRPSTRTFQAPSHGGDVSIVTGTKKMQLTADKRIFVTNSCRTVPYGFEGTLQPI